MCLLDKCLIKQSRLESVGSVRCLSLKTLEPMDFSEDYVAIITYLSQDHRQVAYRVRRDCPDPYFFPELGSNPVGIGIPVSMSLRYCSGSRRDWDRVREKNRDRDNPAEPY